MSDQPPPMPPPSPYPPEMLAYAPAEMAAYPGSPWVAIWTRPRAVTRWVLANDATRGVAALIAGGAIASATSNLTYSVARPRGDPLAAIATLVLGVAIGFLIDYFAAPWLLARVGRWFGGRGDDRALRAAVAYAKIPQICGIALTALGIVAALVVNAATGAATPATAPAVAVAPATVPTTAPVTLAAVLGNVPIGLIVTLAIVGLLRFGISLWTLAVYVGCVAAAHRFSIPRAIGTFAIAMVGVIVLSLLAAWPFARLALRL